ncbi:MAG: phosphatase PAP2 family protein [bacterium]|nr:phosphatase PAP2 family protein [bacterium]
MTFDIIIFRFINNLAGQSTALDLIGVFCASALIWVMAVSLLIIFFHKTYLREQRHEFATVLIAAFAGLFAWVTNTLIGLVLFRPRPFVALADVHQLVLRPISEKSFPSEHATLAFAIAVAVFLAHRRLGWWFLAGAVLVAVGRVFVGVHYPIDVVAGAIMGSVSAWIISTHGRKTFEKLLKKKK